MYIDIYGLNPFACICICVSDSIPPYTYHHQTKQDSQYFRAADLTATAAALAPAAPQQAAVAAAPTTDKPIPTAPAKSSNGEKGDGNGNGKDGRKESTNGRTVVCDRFGHAHLLFGDGAHDLIVGELLGEDGVVMGFGESM